MTSNDIGGIPLPMGPMPGSGFRQQTRRIIVPPSAPANGQPYVEIGSTTDPNFAGMALFSPPSLPPGYAYIVRIAATPPDVTTFVIQLYDTVLGVAVKSVLSATYDQSTGQQIVALAGDTDILSIGGDCPNVNIGDSANFVSLDIGSASNGSELTLDGKTLGFSALGEQDRTLADTTTSASLTPIVGADTRTFTKQFGSTRVLATFFMTLTVAGAGNTGVEPGLRFDNGAGTVVDVRLARGTLVNIGETYTLAGTDEIAAASLPAGNYTVTPIWCRTSGTGTVTLNSTHGLSYSVQEIRES